MQKILILLITLTFFSHAEEIPQTEKDSLITQLMDSRDPAAFEAAYEAGVKAKLPEQTLLEARFLFLVDLDDRQKLATFASKMEAQLEKFSPEESIIFTAKQDFESVVQYLLAIQALVAKDHQKFETHIKEAFWLSPQQAPQYTALLGEFHLNRHLADLKIDLTRQLPLQAEAGKTMNLNELRGDSSLLVLYFWSPWIPQTMEPFHAFLEVASFLKTKKVSVASVLINGTLESRAEADEFQKGLGDKAVGHWVTDSETAPLSSQLRIQSFPIVIALTPDGKVAFHGHPENPAFAAAVQQATESN